MKIYGTQRRILEVVTFVSGLVLSLFLIYISNYLSIIEIPHIIAISISFLYGILMLTAIAMLFEDDSRVAGILLVSIFIPLLLYFATNEYIVFKGILAGICIGFILSLYALFKNRFDILTRVSRAVVTGFFFIMIVYICYGFVMLIYSFSIMLIKNYIILFIIGSVLYLLLQKMIIGINSKDVFVFGPPSSGKTYLLLAFNDYFINFFHGTHNEVIFSAHDDAKDLKIENMLITVERGERIRSTYSDEIAMYTLRGKKKGVFPIELTMIDYGGEQTEKIQQRYQDIVSDLSENLKENEFTVKYKIGTIEFLNSIKKNKTFEKTPELADKVASAYLIKKLKNAGKIIFLIDGKLISGFHGNNKEELIGLFGYYGRIIEKLGTNKKYVLVITKTDDFSEILNIPEKSEKSLEIEKDIYKMLQSVDTFKSLVHKCKNPLYLFAVSADATGSLNQIYPWQVGQVVNI
ncbi:MAG: hypothetical protein C5S46_07235 [Candidatus Methanomarinus sp.]|uniref:Uncharacterized protein n=1 Tax=Candidatus Methanomarinus sp. TaxID=3386244 RepID=A0AC61S943_9EURY|nr:MAG: hypothetical protein C5S41_11395 [ANME-2 cluster archaeon]KAF5425946.1 hypothetical protein C5S42_09065 [ANME-2 cluster archaeon]TKY91169.1 MAG: hypothetical protein C5S46_07235 [ANME-2 cluster archaeon]